jgi:hypothetical protein
MGTAALLGVPLASIQNPSPAMAFLPAFCAAEDSRRRGRPCKNLEPAFPRSLKFLRISKAPGKPLRSPPGARKLAGASALRRRRARRLLGLGRQVAADFVTPADLRDRGGWTTSATTEEKLAPGWIVRPRKFSSKMSNFN